ncbi:Cysteine/Histidine-rich C1 domain family protein [Rhynchospora pubera]|uniref:protein-disulfide reductase n=1 Tax=Rhynchospora pubera TaxID=906938 RepID=A0AAV8CJG8_9POAL|nr:Cysteine/Histidine-rich C1 domain family protein [Rhynchospora pubera]
MSDAYPFTPERFAELKEIAEAEKRNQTIKSILVCGERDYVLSSNGDKVPVSELEEKYVGLYFNDSRYGECEEFTSILTQIHEKLKQNGESFEIVTVLLDDEESSFNDTLTKLPFLVIPFEDKSIEKLIRYFELRSFPTLVMIGSDGKTLRNNCADIIEEHGVDAWEGFPFSQEKIGILEQKAKVKLEQQTLESLLVKGEFNYVVRKDGIKIPVFDLVGKTIIFYFSADWCGRLFLPIEDYNKIKSKYPNSCEIVFVSRDQDEDSYNDFFSSMPWLALPFDDPRNSFLYKTFKIMEIPSLIAIGPSGKMVSEDVMMLLIAYGADAYPFTEVRVKKLQDEIENMAKGWPEKIKHELHESHELLLIKCGPFRCVYCEEMGSNWSYTCDECEFDLHPKCALEQWTLESLLVKREFNYVVGKDGTKIPVSDLVGKTIILYFSSDQYNELFLLELIKEYNKIKSKHFDSCEIVFVSIGENEDSYNNSCSSMPWLALPLVDPRKNFLEEIFNIMESPSLIAIGPSGKIVSKDVRMLLDVYGADAYPFTEERVKELQDDIENMAKSWPEKIKHELDESHELVLTKCGPFWCYNCEEKGIHWSYKCNECLYNLHPKCVLEQPTLEFLLVKGEFNYVVRKDGTKILVSDLLGKTIILYFFSAYCRDQMFPPKLFEEYNKIKSKYPNTCEIVFISNYEDEDLYNNYSSMSWLALPLDDPRKNIYEKPFKLIKIPSLIAIGPSGKTISKDVGMLLDVYGVDAYPFTEERVKELQDDIVNVAKGWPIKIKHESHELVLSKCGPFICHNCEEMGRKWSYKCDECEFDLHLKCVLEQQTLEFLLVNGEFNYVIRKDGTKIPVSDLVGKTIILYFSAYWSDQIFLPNLIEEYNKIKSKYPDFFEILFVSSDQDEDSYNNSYYSMPWLALPLDDPRKSFLKKNFNIMRIPSLIVIGPSGKTVSKDVRMLLDVYGADAYPFTDDRVKELQDDVENMGKSWPEKIKHELDDWHEFVLTKCPSGKPVSKDVKMLLNVYGADAYPFTEERVKKLQDDIENMTKGWPEKIKHELHESHELVLRSEYCPFICDGCKEMGRHWSYKCDECEFNLHLKCALKKDDREDTRDDHGQNMAKEGYVREGDVCRKVECIIL